MNNDNSLPTVSDDTPHSPVPTSPSNVLAGAPQEPVTQSAATDTTSTGLSAEDADVIEKEWVAKAKNIVEQTAHDPYEQVAALNKMRSDYMKKRYNKEIPISNQVASQ